MTHTPDEARKRHCCTQDRRCVADNCMAWQEEYTTPAQPHIKRELTGKGYCGHVGKGCQP